MLSCEDISWGQNPVRRCITLSRAGGERPLKEQSMNVFIAGDIRGAYRSEELVSILAKDPDVHIYVNEMKFKSRFRKLISKLGAMITLLSCDCVWVLPCQHETVFLKQAVRFKKKLVTDFYLSFYDTAVNDRKKLQPGSRKAKKKLKSDVYALTHSDKVLFLNESECDYYTSLCGVDRRSIGTEIVPLCIPDKKKAELPYFHKKRDFIRFTWCGTYIPLQGLEKVIKAFALLKKEGVDARLTVWGDSDAKAAPYRRLADRLKCSDSIDFINDKWGDVECWEQYISSESDCSMGIFGDSVKAHTVLANKVLDGVAFKTPVITAPSGGVAEYFDESSMVIAEPEPEVICEAMKKVTNADIGTIESMTGKAYDIYKENFTRECYEKRVKDILKEL